MKSPYIRQAISSSRVNATVEGPFHQGDLTATAAAADKNDVYILLYILNIAEYGM